MPLQLLRTVKKNAGHMACNSFLYNWSLRQGEVPDHFIIRPVEPWPGDAQAAKLLFDGIYSRDGEQLRITDDCWQPQGVSADWLAHMHGFAWLRDLRSLGGEEGRSLSRAMIDHWIKRHRGWSAMSWHPACVAERISMWICSYDFFGSSAAHEFHDLFFDSLARQARHLSRAMPGELYGIDLLKSIKGLLYAGLSLPEREGWIEQALGLLARETDRQILSDGAHISRSPAQLLQALQIYLDIRTALTSADYPLPESVQHAIDRMGPALRFFRYGDGYLALFNGTQKGNRDLIDCVLGQAGVTGKGLHSLPSGGFEKISQGRSLVMFDSGKVPAWPHDKTLHAAPLAFEFCYGRERVFVSCGTHPASEEWREALRATPAHNALTLDDRNAGEIRENGHFARKVRNAVTSRQDTKQAALIQGEHDGYVALNGVSHMRRIYLSNQGHDLRGEDMLSSIVGMTRPLPIAIRFHIHPRVLVSLVQDGDEALLRLPSGTGWRFHHAGGRLALEDSIYMGEGARPRKTKQLVIYDLLAGERHKIKWALQREGA